MGAMDLRGAVLRGWRLVLLLALLGAAIGAFTAPSAPTGAAGGTIVPGIWTATTIIGPTPGHGGLPLTRVYLDAKNPTVVATAAETSGVGVPATQLQEEIKIENGRQALGLGKRGSRWIRLHAIGVEVTWFTAQSATALGQRGGQRRVGLRERAVLGGLQHLHHRAGQRGHQHRGPTRPDRQPALWHQYADRQSGAARDQESA